MKENLLGASPASRKKMMVVTSSELERVPSSLGYVYARHGWDKMCNTTPVKSYTLLRYDPKIYTSN